MVDDLADDLLDGGIDGAPLVREHDGLSAGDMVCKSFEQVIGIMGEPKKGLTGKLDAKGFQLQGMVFDGHIEVL